MEKMVGLRLAGGLRPYHEIGSVETVSEPDGGYFGYDSLESALNSRNWTGELSLRSATLCFAQICLKIADI